ncbi:DUF4177 domain-containing protein [Alcanivorax sp. S71-1-4]|uniref:DUF4177 domain-containing protein n=1 Tax=Alcanivorax sp. S71-1-4 TaxID=1177159 RepID=UPI00135BEAB6|nr:DUF4177 domain-containing protein [Alcanivorax sp. S71-1-4]
MPRWEYKTIKLATTGWFAGGNLDEGKLDEYMNLLGRDGWELVSAFDTSQAYGASRNIVAIFKRSLGA